MKHALHFPRIGKTLLAAAFVAMAGAGCATDQSLLGKLGGADAHDALRQLRFVDFDGFVNRSTVEIEIKHCVTSLHAPHCVLSLNVIE